MKMDSATRYMLRCNIATREYNEDLIFRPGQLTFFKRLSIKIEQPLVPSHAILAILISRIFVCIRCDDVIAVRLAYVTIDARGGREGLGFGRRYRHRIETVEGGLGFTDPHR